MTRRKYASDEEAFLAQAKQDGSCLIWSGSKQNDGYGRIRRQGKEKLAHRYAWERVNGAIPEGMFIDHTCWNRDCVNVAHLRLATNKQNLENRAGPQRNSKSGVRGVYWNKALKKWHVTVGHEGKVRYGGIYADLEEAKKAAHELRSELFTHYQPEGR